MKELSFPPPPCGVPKDVVVIGGGVVGALTAFELQRAGHRVTLLEAKSWGNGSSSRSAACIRAQFDTPSTVKGMIYCKDYYKQWVDIVGGKYSPMVESGYLFLKDYTVDMEKVKKTVEMQRAAGLVDVEILSPASINKRERFPYIETTGVKGATWCPSDGFLDPAVVYGDASEAAIQLGAVAVQNAEVVEVVWNGSLPVAVKTADGREFAGDVFVNAGGVWAPSISAMFSGHNLDIKARRRYLYSLKGFNGSDGDFMTREDFAKLPMIITPRGCYCRRESGGNLMIGWLHTTPPVKPEFGDQDTVEPGYGTGITEYGPAARKEIQAYIPDVDKMGQFLKKVGAGFYEDTPDHNPFIGHDPGVKNLIHAAGFSGHGLMHAPFTAWIVANLVASGSNLDKIELPNIGEVDIRTFAVGRAFTEGESMVI